MKLFPAKCHEWAALRKLWRQMGNSSLLPAKCWPLLHVIAGISAQFSNFAFVLFCYITNHFKMTGPLGNSEFCFPRISMFPLTSSWETLRFSGNEIHCSPRDQSLSVKCHTKFCTGISNCWIGSLSFFLHVWRTGGGLLLHFLMFLMLNTVPQSVYRVRNIANQRAT